MVSGFINLHKPLTWTSHDCVAKVRGLLKLKKVGHAGTLDPMASGVLPIALGRATRLIPFLPEDKTYRAIIRFGITTSSDDLEGEIVAQAPVPQLRAAAAIAPLSQFLGTIDQIPPRYSAIQVNGKRLYKLARQGEAVEVPPRTVTVHQLTVEGWQGGDFPELTVTINCSAGTYIRSIARDWGARLGVGATLAGLVRTASGGFHLADSLTLEEVATGTNTSTVTPIPPATALAHIPRLTLPEPTATRWRQGQKLTLPLTDLPPGTATAYAVFDPTERFLGITEIAAADSDNGCRLVAKMVYEAMG
ncbi:MAG: tRNA pseudouridine(55) synthase TruB [Cyanobacteria bacterium]|nr:tRNA pseudouridine(55) synthase TruB [Cyanobacteriota bacterium]MDA0865826.1 tRNA pseudouridine(55) synthase TruB [Cyanobacteriota bacterium]